LADFGISSEVIAQRANITLGGKGTPGYRAPELSLGEIYTNKVDIWAMGCILYELTIGTKLFASDSEVMRFILSNRAVNVVVDDSLDQETKHRFSETICHMLQAQPSFRPSAASLLEKFRYYCRPTASPGQFISGLTEPIPNLPFYDQYSDLEITLIPLWQESIRSHFSLGQYSEAENFIRKILEGLEAKYDRRFKRHDEVIQMIATVYCRVNEWDKAGKILTELLKNKRERPVCEFDPIHDLAEINFEAAIQPVLEMGVNVGENVNSTDLHLAVNSGQEKIVRLLLEMGVDVTAKVRGGVTPLIMAAAHGHKGIVTLLLNNGSDVNEKNDSGATALHWAASKGHEAVVRLLLERNANVNEKSKENGSSALQAAAHCGSERIVRLLLEKGAHVDSVSAIGQTPLMSAAGQGHQAIVSLLLENGAEVDRKSNEGSTALAHAVGRGHEAIGRLLLERGASVKLSLSLAGETTVLHLAAGSGQEGVVRMLLSRKSVEVDSKNSSGYTALYLAIVGGHEAVVRRLLENGANFKSRFNHAGKNFTMLHLAASVGYKGIVQLLLEKGADIGAKNGAGGRAVDVATAKGHMAVVRLLQDYKKQNSTCVVG